MLGQMSNMSGKCKHMGTKPQIVMLVLLTRFNFDRYIRSVLWLQIMRVTFCSGLTQSSTLSSVQTLMDASGPFY